MRGIAGSSSALATHSGAACARARDPRSDVACDGDRRPLSDVARAEAADPLSDVAGAGARGPPCGVCGGAVGEWLQPRMPEGTIFGGYFQQCFVRGGCVGGTGHQEASPAGRARPRGSGPAGTRVGACPPGGGEGGGFGSGAASGAHLHGDCVRDPATTAPGSGGPTHYWDVHEAGAAQSGCGDHGIHGPAAPATPAYGSAEAQGAVEAERMAHLSRKQAVTDFTAVIAREFAESPPDTAAAVAETLLRAAVSLVCDVPCPCGYLRDAHTDAASLVGHEGDDGMAFLPEHHTVHIADVAVADFKRKNRGKDAALSSPPRAACTGGTGDAKGQSAREGDVAALSSGVAALPTTARPPGVIPCTADGLSGPLCDGDLVGAADDASGATHAAVDDRGGMKSFCAGGTVKGEQEVSGNAGDPPGPLGSDNLFGASVADTLDLCGGMVPAAGEGAAEGRPGGACWVGAVLQSPTREIAAAPPGGHGADIFFIGDDSECEDDIGFIADLAVTDFKRRNRGKDTALQQPPDAVEKCAEECWAGDTPSEGSEADTVRDLVALAAQGLRAAQLCNERYGLLSAPIEQQRPIPTDEQLEGSGKELGSEALASEDPFGLPTSIPPVPDNSSGDTSVARFPTLFMDATQNEAGYTECNAPPADNEDARPAAYDDASELTDEIDGAPSDAGSDDPTWARARPRRKAKQLASRRPRTSLVLATASPSAQPPRTRLGTRGQHSTASSTMFARRCWRQN